MVPYTIVPNVQHDTSVESRAAPGDPDKEIRAATNLSVSGEAVDQPEEQTFGRGAQTEERRYRPVNAPTLGKVWKMWDFEPVIISRQQSRVGIPQQLY